MTMTEPPGHAVVLGVLAAEKKAAVLDHLTAADPSVETSAAEVAMSRLEAVSVDDVAVRVEDALRALDQDDLAARAGPTRYGYTEPTQAAWELLEEALEPWLEDPPGQVGTHRCSDHDRHRIDHRVAQRRRL
jgi:hypothetical protein